MLENYPEKISASQLAKILRISPLTLTRWGNFIPFDRINDRGDKVYNKSDVIKWINDKEEKN